MQETVNISSGTKYTSANNTKQEFIPGQKLLTHTVLNLFYSATIFCIVYRINSIHLRKKNLFKSCKKLLRSDAFFFKFKIIPRINAVISVPFLLKDDFHVQCISCFGI